MMIEKYLSVTATYIQKPEDSAKYIEEQFAREVSKAIISKSGRVSDYGANFSNSKKWTVYTKVWTLQTYTFPGAEKPEVTEKILRRWTEGIKKALREYGNVAVTLVTTKTEVEVL